MKFGRTFSGMVAALTLAISQSALGADAARVRSALSLAPTDAAAVVVVPSLEQANQGIARLGEQLGLKTPQMADVAGEFKRMTGLSEGVRDAGAMLVVLPKVPEQGESLEALILMPVSDYNTLVQSLGGDASQPVSPVSLPGGFQGFVRRLGDHAVLGEHQAAVQDYAPGNNAQGRLDQLGQLGERYVLSGDISILIDLERAGGRLLASMDAFRQMAGAQIAAQPGGDAAVAAGLPEVAMRAMIRDGQAAAVSLELGEQGMGLTWAMQFKPGSAMANMLTTGGNAGQHLARLPRQTWLFASAFDLAGIDRDALIRNVETAAQNNQQGVFEQALAWLKPVANEIDGAASVFYLPPQMGMMGGSMLSGVTLFSTPQPQQLIQANRQYIEGLNGTAIEAPAPAAQQGLGGLAGPTQVTFNTQYVPNALQVEGINVDQYQVQYLLPPHLMQQAGPAMMLLGGMNQSGYIAQAGQSVLMTTVTDAQLVKQAIATANTGNGLGADESLQRVRNHGLPPNLVWEGYLGVGGLAQAINQAVAMFAPEQELNLQPPVGLAPVAMGVGLRQSGVAARVYLPGDVMGFIRTTVEKLQPMFVQPPNPALGPDAGPGR